MYQGRRGDEQEEDHARRLKLKRIACLASNESDIQILLFKKLTVSL